MLKITVLSCSELYGSDPIMIYMDHLWVGSYRNLKQLTGAKSNKH